MKKEIKARIVRKALLTRAFEEKILELYQKGFVRGTVHTCIGQEFVGATLAESLLPEDSLFSNHRGHGHFLSCIGNDKGLLAEILGLEEGLCRGLGGSQHLHQGNFYSNGIQGGMTAVAVGAALVKKMDSSLRTATKSLAVVFLGDGTFGEGLVYEALNMASKFAAPVLFLIEDNGIAQSTPSELALAGSYEGRASAFAIPYFEGNTWDWEKLTDISAKAVQQVRSSQTPAVLRVQTCRLKAHSKGDDTRSKETLAENEARDPLNLLLKDKESAQIFQELKDHFSALTEELSKKKPLSMELKPKTSQKLSWKAQMPDSKFYGQALNESFHQWMDKDLNTVFIGEDILSPYGGAFKIAKDLSSRFEDRVLSTPISEAAIVGLAAGMALEQKVPIAEIMFGDFLGLAFDQILNHAAKFQEMYNLQRPFKMLLRTPMGGGRAYGPTHSQSLESIS